MSDPGFYRPEAYAQHRWTTASEINFLDMMGLHSHDHVDVGAASFRVLCLTGYIESCFRRSDWGEVDRAAALAHATKLLALAEA